MKFYAFILLFVQFNILPSTSFLFREYEYPKYHTHYTITREALARVAVTYITGESVDPDISAVETLSNIFNTDETAQEQYGEAEDDILASMSERYREIYHHPTWLMTDELVVEGNEFLMQTRKTIIDMATIDKADMSFIRELIAEYLLTLQMFYCNTNWVEIKANKVCDTLGVVENFDIPIANSDEATCYNCQEEVEDNCADNLIVEKLTSGYLELEDKGGIKPWQAEWRDIGKCSHGGRLDFSRKIPAFGGINKETPEYLLSPHSLLHNASGQLAIRASVDFFLNTEYGLLPQVGKGVFEKIFQIKYQNHVVTEVTNTTVNETYYANTTDNSVKSQIPTEASHITYQSTCFNCFQPSLSLVLVIDDTSSMSDDIFNVRRQAIEIVNKALSYEQGLANYILVTFNDPSYRNTYYKTTNGRNMIDKLNMVRVDGGGDCPEYAFTGLKTGIMNANPGSCVFLFTDADPKDYSLCREVGNLVKRKNIHLVTFLTGQCNGDLKAGKSSDCIQTEQQPFTCSSRGKRDVDPHNSFGMFSGLGGTVISAPDREITAPLQTLLEKNMDIHYVYIAHDKMGSGRLMFPVDEYVSVLVVEIIGTSRKDEIRFETPDGSNQRFIGKNTLEYVGRNTHIASIMTPTAGNWTLKNLGMLDWTVHVKGQGDIEIKVKFLERISGSLLDIQGKPLSGHNITIVTTVTGLNRSSTVDNIIIYSTNHTELNRQPVSVNKDFNKLVAVADFSVPYQSFSITLEGRDDDNNIYHRTTESFYQPSIAEIKMSDFNGKLYPGMVSNLSFIVTNFGSRPQTFSVKLEDDMSFVLNPSKTIVTVASQESAVVSFQIRGGNAMSVTTVKVTVSLMNNEVLQEKKIKLMVAEFIPPNMQNINMSPMCAESSLNFQNCSSQNINVSIEVESTDLVSIYCKPKSVLVQMENGTRDNVYNVNVSGDCCMPKFRFFLKDGHGNLLEKAFDFTDGNGFSATLPAIDQPPEVKIKKTVSKLVIYVSAGGGAALLVIIGISICVLTSRKRRKSSVSDNIHMKHNG